MNDILIFAMGASIGIGIGTAVTSRAMAQGVRHYRRAMQGYHDELVQAQNRIHRALAQVTPGANSTVTRMARLLCGRQA